MGYCGSIRSYYVVRDESKIVSGISIQKSPLLTMLKKFIPIIALVPLVFLALTPPLHLALDCTINSTFWLWMTFIAGFLAFLFLYQKVSVWLKLFVVWCFASCFVSKAPYMSFTMYWSLIVCAYYYVLCRKIDDWTYVKKAVQAIFFFIILLNIMQMFGKDTLLNFGHTKGGISGIIGNPMIASSFTCILAPFLIFNPLNWIPLSILSFTSGSSGAMLSMGAGIAVYSISKFRRFRLYIILGILLICGAYAWQTGDFSYNTMRSGRLPVYKKTVELCVKRPLGYGVGNFKVLFQVLCGEAIASEQPGRAWLLAHNTYLQILFETGFIGFFLLMGWIITILKNVIRNKKYIQLAGLAIIGANGMVHFPDRMVSAVLIIVAFLAYCSKKQEA